MDYEYGLKLKLQKAINLAEKGNVKAQFKVGELFSNDGDFIEAFKWYKLAAEQGHEAAQYHVGYYMFGGIQIGEDPDKEGARKWFLAAAKQGNKNAKELLRGLYTNGPHDPKGTLVRAKQGSADAQYNLGYMYYNGSGVAENTAEAMKWWRLAGRQNHGKAAWELFQVLPVSGKESKKWRDVAAKNGGFQLKYITDYFQ